MAKDSLAGCCDSQRLEFKEDQAEGPSPGCFPDKDHDKRGKKKGT